MERAQRDEASGPARLFVQIADGNGTDRGIAPVVFLHGLGGTHRYWSAGGGARHLPGGAALLDLLGFGRSPRPLTRYTLDKHVSALESTLSPREPFVLVGHSLGAAIATAYAARHPDNVEALVLISLPAYGGRKRAIRWLRRRPRGWFYTNMVLTVVTCILTRRLFGPLLPYLVRDVPREVAQDLVEHNFMSSTTSLWNVLYRHDIRRDAEALPDDLPVVFIHGTEDDTAPIETIRDLADQRPGWCLVGLYGVDHHPWLRDPEACADVIAAASVSVDA